MGQQLGAAREGSCPRRPPLQTRARYPRPGCRIVPCGAVRCGGHAERKVRRVGSLLPLQQATRKSNSSPSPLPLTHLDPMTLITTYLHCPP